MTIQDFENALHSDCFGRWIMSSFDIFIDPAGFVPAKKREDEITRELVRCIGKPNIISQLGVRNGRADILDNLTNDIGEAAHNGLYNGQTALFGINHIIKDYFKRLKAGFRNDYFGLLYLLDVENLCTTSKFSYNPFNRQKALAVKVEIENYLMLLPGGIQIQEPFHRIKDPSGKESTILNYDIYVMKFKFSNANSKIIYDNFKDKLDYFIKKEFDMKLLTII